MITMKARMGDMREDSEMDKYEFIADGYSA